VDRPIGKPLALRLAWAHVADSPLSCPPSSSSATS
jgi:hypothetical protein